MIVRRLLSVVAVLSMTVSAFANNGRVERVEPLSWWTGMNTPLQLMLYGKNIGGCSLSAADGTEGLRVTAVHRADSPDYLFADVEIDADAAAGTYRLVLTDETGSETVIEYVIAERREGSRERQGFSTADMIYLLMPDRFADGDPSIDETDDTREETARHHLSGRHGGDIQGIIDHLDYIAGTGPFY